MTEAEGNSIKTKAEGNSIKTEAEGIGSASIAAIILITLVLVILCIGGVIFYLKNMFCLAPQERDIGEKEQEMQEMVRGRLFFFHLEILF